MKKHQNNSVRASALQVTLSLGLLVSLAILFASSMKATGPVTQARPQPQVVAQPGFYPALPTGPAPTCTPIEIDDKISTSDPKQLGRINPGGVASSCGAPNACNTISGMYHFRDYTFTNDTGAPRCVTATLSSSCTGANAIFAAAYAGGFDPSNICANLIGDSGTVTNGSNISFSFNVAAGATFDVVVNETTANAGCEFFKLDIFGLCQPTPSPTPTATPPSRISQITPTNVTCSQFLSGTAPTLSLIEYSLRAAVINQVDPGVFFYWVQVTAAAGSNTFTVNEAITTGNFSTLFAMQSGSNVFTSDCNTLHPTISQLGGAVTVQFNAPSAGTYVILIKFSANTVKGAAAPSPTTVHYNISTAGVADSIQGLDLNKKH